MNNLENNFGTFFITVFYFISVMIGGITSCSVLCLVRSPQFRVFGLYVISAVLNVSLSSVLLQSYKNPPP